MLSTSRCLVFELFFSPERSESLLPSGNLESLFIAIIPEHVMRLWRDVSESKPGEKVSEEAWR